MNYKKSKILEIIESNLDFLGDVKTLVSFKVLNVLKEHGYKIIKKKGRK